MSAGEPERGLSSLMSRRTECDVQSKILVGSVDPATDVPCLGDLSLHHGVMIGLGVMRLQYGTRCAERGDRRSDVISGTSSTGRTASSPNGI